MAKGDDDDRGTAARLIRQLLMTDDREALKRLQGSRLVEHASVDELERLRAVIMELSTWLAPGASRHGWDERLAEVEDALGRGGKEDEGAVEAAPPVEEAEPEDGTPERLDRPAAGPAPLPAPKEEEDDEGPVPAPLGPVPPPPGGDVPHVGMSAEEAVQRARRAAPASNGPVPPPPLRPPPPPPPPELRRPPPPPPPAASGEVPGGTVLGGGFLGGDGGGGATGPAAPGATSRSATASSRGFDGAAPASGLGGDGGAGGSSPPRGLAAPEGAASPEGAANSGGASSPGASSSPGGASSIPPASGQEEPPRDARMRAATVAVLPNAAELGALPFSREPRPAPPKLEPHELLAESGETAPGVDRPRDATVALEVPPPPQAHPFDGRGEVGTSQIAFGSSASAFAIGIDEHATLTALGEHAPQAARAMAAACGIAGESERAMVDRMVELLCESIEPLQTAWERSYARALAALDD